MHMPLWRHLYGFSSPRIATRPGDPNLGEETAKSPQFNPVTLAEGPSDLVQDRVESRLDGMRGQMRMCLTKLCKQL